MVVLITIIGTVSAEGDNSLSGREIVDQGKGISLSGTLSEKEDEWYLTQGGKEYALHFGNYEVLYPKGMGLKAGLKVDVQGFAVGTDVSVTTLKLAGQEFALRSADGTPLWAGRGQGRNRTIADQDDHDSYWNDRNTRRGSNGNGDRSGNRYSL